MQRYGHGAEQLATALLNGIKAPVSWRCRQTRVASRGRRGRSHRADVLQIGLAQLTRRALFLDGNLGKASARMQQQYLGLAVDLQFTY